MTWNWSHISRFGTCALLVASPASFLAAGCNQSSMPDSASGGSAGSAGNGGAAGAGFGGSAGSAAQGGTAGTGAAGGAGAGGVAGGAGSGGSAGSAGSGGTGGIAVEPGCLNAVKDAGETGVDCGGECPACTDYEINPPDADNGSESTCNGGDAFMCPRTMLFSPEMKQAAADDWSADSPPFTYGVVGHNISTGGVDSGLSGWNACCQCYQLVFDTPVGSSNVPTPKSMIVQAFNTGAEGFDIFMGVGGFGDFNGCTMGGAMYSAFPETGDNFGGGVKANRYAECGNGTDIASDTCQSYVASLCSQIEAPSESVEAVTENSCIQANKPESLYHNNWNVKAKRVECPENLTRVTGCRLNDQGLPDPDPAIQTAAQASAAGGFVDSHTTSMQDCCRPTCAWPNNVDNTDGEWEVFYSCGEGGIPWTN